MRGALVAPLGGTDRREVGRPFSGRGGTRVGGWNGLRGRAQRKEKRSGQDRTVPEKSGQDARNTMVGCTHESDLSRRSRGYPEETAGNRLIIRGRRGPRRDPWPHILRRHILANG